MTTTSGGMLVLMMRFPEDVDDDVRKRLRRVEGQIRGLQKMLDEGKACREVITQLSAAYRLIGAGMRYCVMNPDAEDSMSPEELEKLFLKVS